VSLLFLFTLVLIQPSWSLSNTLFAKYEYQSEHPDAIIDNFSENSVESREIEKEINGSVSIYLDVDKVKAETVKVTAHHVSHGTMHKQYSALPVKDETVTKLLQDLEEKVIEGMYEYTTIKTELEAVEARLIVDLKKEKFNSNESQTVSKKQRYKELRKGAKECAPGVYKFKGSANRQLIGCGLVRQIESRSLVKTPETDTYLLSSLVSQDGSGESQIKRSCNIYKYTKPLNPSPLGGVVDLKLCIAMHGNLPVAYFREGTVQSPDGSLVKTRYKLTHLSIDHAFEEETFDFEKNAACPGDLKEKKSC